MGCFESRTFSVGTFCFVCASIKYHFGGQGSPSCFHSVQNRFLGVIL
jgi:hypothetical protein